MNILDSGKRREFDSGAVRDIAEGKGRCDLLPLDVVAELLDDYDHPYLPINYIAHYVYEGNTSYLANAIHSFCVSKNITILTLLLEVSKHYEEGAKKYADRNWEKGIPLHCYIDSGVRHYLKYLRGDTDEPHDRAFVWNMLGAMWTHKHRPEMIDLPFATEGTQNDKEN